MLQPHHDGSPLHVSNPDPALGDTIRVRLRVPEAHDIHRVVLRVNPDQEPRWVDAVRLGDRDGWQWWEAPLEVANPVVGYRWLLLDDTGGAQWVNAAGIHPLEPVDRDDFRATAFAAPPVWGRSSVMYQVFPDRFARSPASVSRATPPWGEPAAWDDAVEHLGPGTPLQFYGGDLDGVAARLDHLGRLGIDLLYLTPFFPAESNHRYNATSFDHVDPLLGGDAALVRLVDAAHARGIRVIGDLTTNHSGDAHEWFRTACADPDSIERSFYYFDPDDPEKYVCWLGYPSLPKFDWNSRELRRRFIEGPDSVVAKWLKPPYSLDGWRIDVANMTGRHGADDLNGEVRRLIRDTMVAVNPDTLLLAEITNDAAADVPGDAWHGAMTYANLTRPLWGWLSEPAPITQHFGIPLDRMPQYTGSEVLALHRAFAAGFPWRVRLHNMNALDTHDTARFATHARPGALEVAMGLVVALPGIPVIWQGDEFGLTADDGEHSRTPLPWDRLDEHGGTIDLVAELVGLRRAHPVLSTGGVRWLHASDDALAFVRESAEECVLVLAARAAARVQLEPDAATGAPERLRGAAEASVDAVGLRLEASTMSFTAWRLPGVETP